MLSCLDGWLVVGKCRGRYIERLGPSGSPRPWDCHWKADICGRVGAGASCGRLTVSSASVAEGSALLVARIRSRISWSVHAEGLSLRRWHSSASLSSSGLVLAVDVPSLAGGTLGAGPASNWIHLPSLKAGVCDDRSPN